VAGELENTLRAKIQPLLDQWKAAASTGGSGTLVVEPQLAFLKVVSGGSRFWAGPFAGDSSIDMDLVITDQTTGQQVAKARITRNADSNAGAWSIGQSDENLLDYIASIAYQYLKDNYGNTNPPATVASPTSSSSVTFSAPTEKKPITKTYASLVQYDGPKIKSGITLDAQLMDDGSGSGEANVNDIGNHLLKGTFTTIKPDVGDWPKPNLLDRATLIDLKIRNDRPWVIATVSNADTTLECVYGETLPLGQKKGACRDNYGNRYWLYIRP
jgi:hypothetical protein